MIELGEARALVHQLRLQLLNKTITHIELKNSPHTFAWFNEEASFYHQQLTRATIIDVIHSAHMIRICVSSGVELAFSEDIVFLYQAGNCQSKKNQLILFFDDAFLEIKVRLYGFFLIGTSDHLSQTNPYYHTYLTRLNPFDEAFTLQYFQSIIQEMSPKLSLKQALATNQTIPGLGNGSLQDILFYARKSPRTKIGQLTLDDIHLLYDSIKQVMNQIASQNGRMNQLDLYGNFGSYKTIMGKETTHCPLCHAPIQSENYMGGKVYYCNQCQH